MSWVSVGAGAFHLLHQLYYHQNWVELHLPFVTNTEHNLEYDSPCGSSKVDLTAHLLVP